MNLKNLMKKAIADALKDARRKRDKKRKKKLILAKSKEIRDWETPLCSACCSNPGFTLMFMCCPTICAHKIRLKALGGDLTKYSCCQGNNKCGKCIPFQKKWPNKCSQLEAWWCLGGSVYGTKHYVQDERDLIPDPCDKRLKKVDQCLKALVCITKIISYVCGGCDCCGCMLQCCQSVLKTTVMVCRAAQVDLELSLHPTADDYSGTNIIINTQPRPGNPFTVLPHLNLPLCRYLCRHLPPSTLA